MTAMEKRMNELTPSARLKRWAVLFLLLLTVLGLLLMDGYGVPCDERSEQVILQENLKEYALALGDEGAVSYYDAIGVQRAAESIERDHGQAAYYPIAAALQIEDGWLKSTLFHAWTWLIFMEGVAALYMLCRGVGVGHVLSAAAGLMLYLSPRFFAEGHYNNKDVVLLSLVLVTLAIGVRFLQRPKASTAAAFSLVGALATNTKIVGAWAWGLVCLFTLVRLIARRELTWSKVRLGLLTLAVYLGAYALLTPALWSDPLAYMRYVLGNASGFTRWPGVVVYQGMTFDQAGGQALPHLYLPIMILSTTPVMYLLLMAFGQVRALLDVGRSREPLKDGRLCALLVLTLFWVVPLVYAVFARPLMYNGWRHFYFLYAGLCALGGYGMQTVADAMRKADAGRAICGFALCCMFGYYGVGLLINHPYQYAYYNSIASNQNLERDYELDYWDVSTNDALKQLCTTEARNQALDIVVAGSDPMSQFGLDQGYPSLPAGYRALLRVTDDPAQANYVFLNTTYARIYSAPIPEGYRPLLTLTSYGSRICEIYEKLP
ncbi:MAG: hypothetical protein PHY12_12410 [Eubacteriales bacterium]|nr:hypothetical protein [Eubacteriales bacterium]